ncbi:MAG: response regulator [Acidobacteriaceae bacterium]|nr:response regulator [Acidobacteriaceae bacterium]
MQTKLSLLVIDDVPVNCLLMENIAREIGNLEIFSASNGLEALNWCETHQADIVIVDWMMPQMDGLAFLRAYRQRPDSVDVPIVMITASEELEIRLQALDMGANDFLVRPLQPAEIRARLRNMLVLRRAYLALTNQAACLAAEVAAATAQIRARERELVARLAGAVEYRDPETGAHVARMALYSQAIAQQLGLNAAHVDLILEAAPMHDVGKVGIPDHILLKPGRLTPEEMQIMRQHAELGGEILTGSESALVQMAESIAIGHHERWDGAGYPDGLRGSTIPIEARIVAVADVFDALTSIRPYKSAWSLDAARDYLRDQSGSHFDPDCVDAFLRAWPEIIKIHEKLPDTRLSPPRNGGPAKVTFAEELSART